MEYSKALWYANKIGNWNTSYSSKDLLHDTILTFYNNHNKNLLDEDFPVVAKFIRLQHSNYVRGLFTTGGRGGASKFIKPKESFKRIWYSVEETPFHIREYLNPENLLEARDIYVYLSDFEKQVLDLKLAGYEHREIEKILNKSNPPVTKAVKRIKQLLMHNNPFNGSPVTVVRTVKRDTFDESPKYKEKFEMGDDSDYNEYYTLMTSKENPKEGLLIREIPKHTYYEKLA